MDGFALPAPAANVIWMLHAGMQAVVVDPDDAVPMTLTSDRQVPGEARILGSPVDHPAHGDARASGSNVRRRRTCVPGPRLLADGVGPRRAAVAAVPSMHHHVPITIADAKNRFR